MPFMGVHMFKILLNSRIGFFDAVFVYDINFPFVAIVLTSCQWQQYQILCQTPHFNVEGVFLRYFSVFGQIGSWRVTIINIKRSKQIPFKQRRMNTITQALFLDCDGVDLMWFSIIADLRVQANTSICWLLSDTDNYQDSYLSPLNGFFYKLNILQLSLTCYITRTISNK